MNFDHIRKLSTAIGEQLNAEVSFEPDRAAGTMTVRIKPRAFGLTTEIVFHDGNTDEHITTQLAVTKDSLVNSVFRGWIAFEPGFPLETP